MKLYRIKEALKAQLYLMEPKVNDCKTYKELVTLIDDFLGYFREDAQKSHEKNQEVLKECREENKGRKNIQEILNQ